MFRVSGEDLVAYRRVLAPKVQHRNWLWFFRRRSGCRLFHASSLIHGSFDFSSLTQAAL
jgi:hypothetical protein